jgi:hypothetical protein
VKSPNDPIRRLLTGSKYFSFSPIRTARREDTVAITPLTTGDKVVDNNIPNKSPIPSPLKIAEKAFVKVIFFGSALSPPVTSWLPDRMVSITEPILESFSSININQKKIVKKIELKLLLKRLRKLLTFLGWFWGLQWDFLT